MAIRKKAAPKPAMKPAMSTDRKSYQVSKNVKVLGGASSGSPRDFPNQYRENIDSRDLKGAAQAVRQNVKTAAPISKSEAKANARGLKAANTPKKRVK